MAVEPFTQTDYKIKTFDAEEKIGHSSSSSSWKDRVVIKTEPMEYECQRGTKPDEYMDKVKVEQSFPSFEDEPLIETEPELIIPDIVENRGTFLYSIEDPVKIEIESNSEKQMIASETSQDVDESGKDESSWLRDGVSVKQESEIMPNNFTNRINVDAHATDSNLIYHDQSHSPVKLYDDSPVKQLDLKHCEISRKNKNPRKCDLCDFSTNSSSNLTVHKRKHSGEKPYKCDQCEYASSTSTQLTSHKRTHSGEKPFKCDNCDFRSSLKSSIKTHQLTHSGEKRFKCDQCDFHCAHKYHIKTHQLKHSGEKRFKCDLCNFSCGHKTHFKTHQMRHTDEKPFKCDQCDYACSTSSALKSHTRSHSKEKPFKCDKCEYRSAAKRHLKIHQLTHTVDKPFKCDKCDYCSALKSYLKRHQLKHSK